LFHGAHDLNVDVRHLRGMPERLRDAGKQVTCTGNEGLRHGLGDSNERTGMMIEIDRFLASAVGG